MSEYISRNEAHQELRGARSIFAFDKWGRGYAAGITEAIDIIDNISSADVMPIHHCSTCGRNADNGGMYEDGRTMCPIQEHYALLRDGFCHLYSPAKPINCGAIMGEEGSGNRDR